MDSEEIKQLFKKEGGGELKPLPSDIYDQFKDHLEKSKHKAEIAKDMDTDFYIDILSNIKRDEGYIMRFVELRMRKVGEMAIHNAYNEDQKDLTNATQEELELYNKIYDMVKRKEQI